MSKRETLNANVEDYVFRSQAGEPVRLSELFGDQSTLVLVHNMGSQCPHCTQWADDFNRFVPELTGRTAFAVESGDEPAVQRDYHRARAWTFKMVSSQGTAFKADMGFLDKEGRPIGGVSVFTKIGGGLTRVRREASTPSDEAGTAAYFLGLLQD